SRRRHTRFSRDWSSDVCSSDLSAGEQVLANGRRRRTGYFLSEFYEPYAALRRQGHELYIATPEGKAPVVDPEGLKDDYWEDESRSEERRVGKGWRSRWAA